MLTEIDKAYIAGTIDMCGTIAIFKRTSSNNASCVYYCDFSISNDNKDYIEYVQIKLQHGHVVSQSRGNNQKLCNHLIFKTKEIELVLEQILPYIICLEQHAILMLKFLKLTSENIEEQKLIYDELLILNKRGI